MTRSPIVTMHESCRSETSIKTLTRSVVLGLELEFIFGPLSRFDFCLAAIPLKWARAVSFAKRALVLPDRNARSRWLPRKEHARHSSKGCCACNSHQEVKNSDHPEACASEHQIASPRRPSLWRAPSQVLNVIGLADDQGTRVRGSAERRDNVVNPSTAPRPRPWHRDRSL
jgi:hypothetical protein